MQIKTKNSTWLTFTTISSLWKRTQVMNPRLSNQVIPTAVYPNASIPDGKRLSFLIMQYSFTSISSVLLPAGHWLHCLSLELGGAKVSSGQTLQLPNNSAPCSTCKVSFTNCPDSQFKVFKEGTTNWAWACKSGLTRAFSNQFSPFRGNHWEPAAPRPVKRKESSVSSAVYIMIRDDDDPTTYQYSFDLHWMRRGQKLSRYSIRACLDAKAPYFPHLQNRTRDLDSRSPDNGMPSAVQRGWESHSLPLDHTCPSSYRCHDYNSIDPVPLGNICPSIWRQDATGHLPRSMGLCLGYWTPNPMLPP